MTTALGAAMEVSGALAVAVVDLESGQPLAMAGSGVNLNAAAAGRAKMVRAKMDLMRDLELDEQIDDILITLGTQYHVIRPLKGKGASGLFLYHILDRDRTNLALARQTLGEVANSIAV
jgi:hypothetical protein